MKTLLIYNSSGNILFTKTPVEENEVFKYIISDVPNDRQPIRVENNKVVLDDLEEVKSTKKRLEELKKEQLELKQSLLDMEEDF
ncbi:hypothetical protein HMPREF1084_01747 [Clostridium butyricum 60E.3]|uniref:hypothetical protein n=1 Tax=Clostridium butyricum TaxID=1492 RepID=UPI0002D1C43D|nr:hypothetical protein [Clostridium butyricum]ENZ33279.1 hypothetical protein HMPREF1084_01747 [Clostridium butyricum 60E.3]